MHNNKSSLEVFYDQITQVDTHQWFIVITGTTVVVHCAYREPVSIAQKWLIRLFTCVF